MREDLLQDVRRRLIADYQFRERGEWLREGKCPQCGQRSLYVHAQNPRVVSCGRLDKCAWTSHVKDLYSDLFEDWSRRFKPTESNPTATADAYLQYARGLDIQRLKGAYTQETYYDPDRRIASATVRFALPGGGWWERLIDQPGRFDRKARFAPGKSYRGYWWSMPGATMADLAQADEIWLAEGIFDAAALAQAGLHAVSLMSCNNYPEAALADLRRAAAELGKAGPRLIWAFDVGRAGVEYTRKFVARAREEGWTCGAAQVLPDGEGDKLDWNDLLQRDRLGPEHIEEYRWNGEVTIAPSAVAKANLIFQRHRYTQFPFTFGGRLYWAKTSADKANEIFTALAADAHYAHLPQPELRKMAEQQAMEISEIANCTFRTLYYQRDPNIDEGAYYVRIDFPARETVKAAFPGGALTAGSEFKKKLAAVAPGAQWTGTTQQLDRLMQRQWANIRVVEAIPFTGYSIEHEAYIFGDIAVHKGRVYYPNAEDYFELSKRAVKLRTAERILNIDYNPDEVPLQWVPLLVTAYGPKGLVTLAFWFMSLFAEQLRAEQDSLGFLEMTGPPGTGKTTIIEFLWKLFGRANYEGFDPTKATSAGIARTLGQVANMPVVLIEGDRNQETPHARRFEWDELKTAYNGRAVRTRAIANAGMETFEPPFRAAIAIVQNDPVEASPALRERIMGLHFDKTGWGPETKAAANRLARMPMESVSGFIIHAALAEQKVLESYRHRFARHEADMLGLVRNGRLAKNHAQLAGMLDAMRVVITNLHDRDVEAAHELIRTMLVERQQAVESDHPHVELFWERVDWLMSDQTAETMTPINHSRRDDMIAINLVQFEKRCGELRLSLPPMTELKRLLKASKSRKFLGVKPVNSVTGKTVLCWCFERPQQGR